MDNHRVILIRNARFFGGAETYLLNIAKGLRQKNIHPVIWTNENQLFAHAQKTGMEVRKKILGPTIRGKTSFVFFVITYIFLFCYHLAVIRFYKTKDKIDVLHLQSLNDFLLFTFIGKILNIKVVWTVDVAFYPKRNKLLEYWFIRAAERADKIIAVSRFMKKNIIDTGVSKEKIALIYNGVNVNKKLLSKVFSQSRKIKIGFIGKVSKEKGIVTFLKAAQKILSHSPSKEKAEFSVTGNIKNKSLLSRYIDKKIIFRDWQDNLMPVYADLDIIVVPSLVEESFGFVAAEAMSCGKAVVVSNRGALPELVENNKSGIIFNAGDESELANLLINLIGNRQKVDELGKNAYFRARETFELEKMTEKTIDLYETK